WYIGLSSGPEARRPAGAVALSSHARTDTGGARAHRHSSGVDFQLRLRPLSPRRRHLDARLVHGVARRTDMAADTCDRNVRPRGDCAAQRDGLCAAERRSTGAELACLALADTVLRRTDSARGARSDADGA